MKNKITQVAGTVALLSTLLFCVACDDSSDYEGFTEVITPLRCTIPGEILLGDNTKSILDKYKK